MKEAPPEVRRAEVPEEPVWNRDRIVREVREEERRAAARAVEAAREEVRREMETALGSALAEGERLRAAAGEAARREERLVGELDKARRDIASLRSAGEEERRESRSLRRDLAGAEAALVEAGRREETLRDRAARLEGLLQERESGLATSQRLQREAEEERRMAASMREERDVALGRAREAESALEAALDDHADAEARHGREVRDLRAALAEAQDLPPLADLCASIESESYRRGREEVEAERDAALVRLEEARSETTRLLALNQRQQAEVTSLRRDLQFTRREAASPDCSAPVQVATARVREEADQACRAKLAEATTARTARDRSADLRASLREESERAGRLEEDLRASEREVARLAAALERSKQTRPAKPMGKKFDRAVDREVRRRLDEALADERLLAETDRDLAVADAESEAADRMAAFFEEARREWEARRLRLEREERERSEAAFARALQTISSRVERERARTTWEEMR